jgi:glycosyltransferase involved in cell wall biosynthesis
VKIGIDASNLRGGGGLTHISSVLNATDAPACGIDSVIVWGPEKTLAAIEDRPWLIKKSEPVLEKNAIRRAFWQRNRLTELLLDNGCDLLFAPGGTLLSDFRPAVTMSQNLLPFEWKELRRYGLSLKTLRLLALRWSQSRSFQRSAGVIFLTKYARSTVLDVTGPLDGAVAIVPHGVEERFRNAPIRDDDGAAEAPGGRSLTFLYVSPFEPYKHQEKVLEAASALRQQGADIKVRFVGPSGKSFGRFESRRKAIDPEGVFVEVVKGVPFSEMPSVYREADIFLFASSCENMPNIILEAMASGLPILSSSAGPMPEILGEAGIYFNHEKIDSIISAMKEIISSPRLRSVNSNACYEKAKEFTWEICSKRTFTFLSGISR